MSSYDKFFYFVFMPFILLIIFVFFVAFFEVFNSDSERSPPKIVEKKVEKPSNIDPVEIYQY